ncbi:hypothetical protein [Methyloglobulus sp.]|uniref:hypothetical protein n=1 Tax=Methyloglobulus sp. TaxID=2518622 RepID=UPI0032B70E0C
MFKNDTIDKTLGMGFQTPSLVVGRFFCPPSTVTKNYPHVQKSVAHQPAYCQTPHACWTGHVAPFVGLALFKNDTIDKTLGTGFQTPSRVKTNLQNAQHTGYQATRLIGLWEVLGIYLLAKHFCH